jgi:HTH-type transcriptional regulator/antitoxin HipB
MEKMKLYTMDEVLDLHIGKIGTPKRDKFEHDLQMDIIAHKIKEERLRKNLTQTELGELVGVKKSQISKLEKGLGDMRLNTILKVFKALNTNLKIVFETENKEVVLT